MGCWRGDDKGIPSYCQANHYLKEIERADKAYAAPEVVDIYSAACVVGKKNDGYRPRIEEALDFGDRSDFTKRAAVELDMTHAAVRKSVQRLRALAGTRWR